MCLRVLAGFFICLLALALVSKDSAADLSVDLELVLAVDVSGSVDEQEFSLQIGGIAAAFRDPEVHKAIRSGPLGKIAVSLVLWSDPQYDISATPWHIIDGPFEAEVFAKVILNHPRQIPAGSTGIGQALYACTQHIKKNGLSSPRKVIDLSGDGEETAPRDFFVQIWQGRAAAEFAGITINGLAILADEPNLDRYYRARLVTGPGAFVMAVASHEDFAEAVRLKLIREITYRPIVSQRNFQQNIN